MSQGKLKPCPFCGSKDIEVTDNGLPQKFLHVDDENRIYKVRCLASNCGVFVETSEKDDPNIDAKDKWNRRDKPKSTPFIGVTNKIYDAIVTNRGGNIFRRGSRWNAESYVGVGQIVRLGRGGQPEITMIVEVCGYSRKQAFKFDAADRIVIEEQYKFNHAERIITCISVTTQQ